MLDQIRQIAISAGAEIMRIYNSPETVVTFKQDDSPLTAADQASHDLIVTALENLTPDIPVVSEESAHLSPALTGFPRFWLVDPLDGTKEFLKRSGDFTVNIALIENRRPVLGVIYVPVQDLSYFGKTGEGAWKQSGTSKPVPIRIRAANPDALCVVASKDHAGPQVELMLQKLPGAQLASMGSSLKFCLVAEGRADLYPRFVPTMEWDIAAADCILEAAGGAVFEIAGQPLQYQKPGLKNGSIIAVGDRSLNWPAYLP